MTSPQPDIPAGFKALDLPTNAFLNANGPVYVKMEGEHLVLGLRVEERHCSSIGLCHGGMLLTLADLVLTIGVNVQARLSRFLPTVSVTCDFIGAAPRGAWLQARVEVLRTTRNLAFGQGLLSLPDGTPVARISGILKIGGEPDPAYGPERYLG
ncbi:MAG: PaaI family thioesterase [Proteobacteria bacterium]|nr:PaaI family thioesterase [Pseudomonadota bacterium]